MEKPFYTKFFDLLAILLCIICLPALGQNRAISYIEVGSPNPVNRFSYGMAGETHLRVSPQVNVQTGFRLASQYPSGLGDIKAGITLFLKKNSTRWSCENIVNFSNYAPYPMNQLYYRLTFAWQTKHFRVDFGNAFAFFTGSGVFKYHLFRPSFSLKGSLYEDGKPYNIAFFIRNFNRFEAYGSRCTEWGSEISARLSEKWRLFCEPCVMTAGNFNGTATFYNFKCNLGGAFVW